MTVYINTRGHSPWFAVVDDGPSRGGRLMASSVYHIPLINKTIYLYHGFKLHDIIIMDLICRTWSDVNSGQYVKTPKVLFLAAMLLV